MTNFQDSALTEGEKKDNQKYCLGLCSYNKLNSVVNNYYTEHEQIDIRSILYLLTSSLMMRQISLSNFAGDKKLGGVTDMPEGPQQSGEVG